MITFTELRFGSIEPFVIRYVGRADAGTCVHSWEQLADLRSHPSLPPEW